MVALISSYDELQRLTAANRGELVAAKDRITDHALAQTWNLDPTGNWKGFTNFDQATPANDLVQQRTTNAANEITDLTETVGDQWTTPAHDRSGNMTTMPQPDTPTSAYTCSYDAWNRLATVKDGATTIGQYSYDGLNRRIRKYVPGGTDSYQHLYYNAAWQLLETRESPTFLVPATAQYQYVWSLRYLDAPVLRDDLVPTPDVRLYYTGDANFNVTALFEFIEDLTAVERYVYDPYGNLTIYNDDWTATRSTSDFDNSTLFTGQWRDAETALSNYRRRYYHALVGLFITADPIGYQDGLNLSAYVSSNPIRYSDPGGQQKGGGLAKAGLAVGNLVISSLDAASTDSLSVSGSSASITGARNPAVNKELGECKIKRKTVDVYGFAINQVPFNYLSTDVDWRLYFKYNGCDVVYIGLDVSPESHANSLDGNFTIVGKPTGAEEPEDGKCKCCEKAACVEYEIYAKHDVRWYTFSYDRWWKQRFVACGDGSITETLARTNAGWKGELGKWIKQPAETW